MPNMYVWRPCDALESAVAWKSAIEREDGPTSLIFSRQLVDVVPDPAITPEQVARGGYIRRDCEGKPEAIIIATGSEMALALNAAATLATGGRRVRVVSMPSTSAFDSQDEDYRQTVMPRDVTARVAVEAGLTHGWHRYVGGQGRIIGIDRYGESAPWSTAFTHFGFTVDHLVDTVEELIANK
jgi:transketolase